MTLHDAQEVAINTVYGIRAGEKYRAEWLSEATTYYLKVETLWECYNADSF